MYTPVQTGIPWELKGDIEYCEYVPLAKLSEVVYRFWTFKATSTLKNNFNYLVLPDGCMDILFDIASTPESIGALIMTPSVQAKLVQIRNDFSYVGIRLQPGAWRATSIATIGSEAFHDMVEGYNFTSAHAQLAHTAALEGTLQTLNTIVTQMGSYGIVGRSSLAKLLLSRSFQSVEDLVAASGYSRRQLQRVLQDMVGYSPHDFLKIVRFQRAIQSGRAAAEQYSDQSHFIRECKRITGMTPSQLRTTYQLMADSSNAAPAK
jgi:AraC-like DNA-binding protein